MRLLAGAQARRVAASVKSSAQRCTLFNRLLHAESLCSSLLARVTQKPGCCSQANVILTTHAVTARCKKSLSLFRVRWLRVSLNKPQLYFSCQKTTISRLWKDLNSLDWEGSSPAFKFKLTLVFFFWLSNIRECNSTSFVSFIHIVQYGRTCSSLY